MYNPNPPIRISRISISSDHGSTSNANSSSVHKSSFAPNAKPYVQPGDVVQAEASTTHVKAESNDEKKDRHTMPVTRADRKYNDLFQETSTSVESLLNEDFKPLAPSQIGGSYWSSDEKEYFFAALARYGQDDLPNIANAVSTKSQPEIRAYLLLLRDQAERSDTLRTRLLLDPAQIRASYSINEECETVLDLAADSLAQRTLVEDMKAEKGKFGDFWLIHQDLADEIEGRLEESESDEPSGDSTDPPDVEIGQDGDQRSEGEDDSPAADADPPPGQHSSTSPDSDLLIHVPSADLLVPAIFLQLSRNIFMNRRGADHWRKMEALDRKLSSRPAIWHSALDDLRSVAVDRTRELVRATLLQAASRIRATDSRPLVREGDIKTALDIMGVEHGRQEYWAKMPRRYGIRVHTGHSKYRDGRPTNRDEVELTYDEVEAELGSKDAPVVDHSDEDAVRKGEGFPGEEDGESDDSYSASSAGVSQSEADDSEQEKIDYLEAVDGHASHQEQNRLLRLLDRDIFDMGPHDMDNQVLQRRAVKRAAKDDIDHRPTRWRKQVRYEPDWVTEMIQRAAGS